MFAFLVGLIMMSIPAFVIHALFVYIINTRCDDKEQARQGLVIVYAFLAILVLVELSGFYMVIKTLEL